jgi:putative SOS response-associated peptidase YedK
MCTRYISPEVGDIERHWHIGARSPLRWAHEVFPGYQGPFIRAAKLPATASLEFGAAELVVGQWGLVPWFAKERKLKYPTSNARSEELSAKASYKQPWARGQRCVIPAESFFEPNWETGKHVPWRFQRSDGAPWGLAGLWNTWVDKETGEVVESYTMLTLNADAHPLMQRMHKPDPKLPSHLQDKRSVVPIERADVDLWLHAPQPEAAQLLRLADVALFKTSTPDLPALPKPQRPKPMSTPKPEDPQVDWLKG